MKTNLVSLITREAGAGLLMFALEKPVTGCWHHDTSRVTLVTLVMTCVTGIVTFTRVS